MPTANGIEIHRLIHDSPAGTTTAVIVPAWGANVIGFAFHPNELLWPVSVLEPADIAAIAQKPTSFGAPLLAPTPGRVGATSPGTFTFDGREYRMAQPRHGFFRNLPWTVLDHTASAITCALDVRPAESIGTFPFAFRALYHVAVSERRLDCRLSIRSGGGGDQPISAGWHPYLLWEPGGRLRIPASSLWEQDGSDEPVPTGRLRAVAGTSDFRGGREVPADESWDQAFTDLALENGVSQCWLESTAVHAGRKGPALRVTARRIVESALPTLQLYTTPGRPAIAVEPFSSPPDGVNLLAAGNERANVQRLRPNEEAAFEMSLALALRYS